MPKLPTIFSKRSTASADDLEKQAGAARKASMLESMEMAEAIEMLHISAESVVSFTVLLRSSRTQEVKELLLGVGELDLTLREPAPAGGRASRTPMLTFPIDDLVAWLPSDTRFTFYVPLADDDERCQVWHVETSEARQVAAEVTKAAEMRAKWVTEAGLGTKSQKGRRDTKHSIMASLSSFKMLAVEGIDNDDDDEGEEGASAGAGTSASHGAAADDDDDDDVRKFAVTVVVGNGGHHACTLEVSFGGMALRDASSRELLQDWPIERIASWHAAADEFRFYVAATRDFEKFKRGALTCASADAAEQIATLLTAIARAIAEDDGDDGYIEGEPPATRDVGGGRGAVNAAGTLERQYSATI